MAPGGEAPAAEPWQLPLTVGRLRARLPRTSPAVAQQLGWAGSGLLFGLAVAHAFHWSVASSFVAAIVLGALSWLGRGVATVVVSACLTLGAIGVALRVTMVAFPTEGWALSWLWPLAFLMVVGGVVMARRYGFARVQVGVAGVLLEVSAGAGSLALALLCIHRLGTKSASEVLLSSEDNAAWLNTVGGLHNAHGSTVNTTTAVGLFGPVANTFLAFVREAGGGLLPHPVTSASTATIVVSAYVLLIATGPVVAALMVRRTLPYDRPLLTFTAWAGVSAIIVTYGFTTPDHGFLTTGLAMQLVLVAACLLPGRVPDVLDRTGRLRWFAASLAVYAAGAAWIPVAPLGGVVLAAYWAATAWPALRSGPMRRVVVTGALLVPTAVMGWALLQQYRDVVDPLGGGDSLFVSTGGTPAATTTMTVTAIGLVAAAWIAYRGAVVQGLPTFALPLGGVVAYAAAAMLAEGYLTQEAPHYGTIKLLYVTVGLALVLGLADVLASPALGRLRLDAAVFLVVAALFAGTVEQGPVFAAASGHWPKPQLPTVWIKQVTREVPNKTRVLCLGLTAAPDTSQPSLDAYLCDRWASSLQGLDDDPAGDWRVVQLGRLPVSKSVAWIKAAHDLPWTIVVIGSLSKLKDPKAWYAPIVAQPGLHFISSGF